jgi:hypothetical protein
VVDLRTDETVDLRSDPTPRAEYHCMRVWHSVPPDPAADAWQRSSSLVEYPPDLDDLSSDRWRDSLEPGLSAAGRWVAVDPDEPAPPGDGT